jgi:hypothetical protein
MLYVPAGVPGDQRLRRDVCAATFRLVKMDARKMQKKRREPRDPREGMPDSCPGTTRAYSFVVTELRVGKFQQLWMEHLDLSVTPSQRFLREINDLAADVTVGRC